MIWNIVSMTLFVLLLFAAKKAYIRFFAGMASADKERQDLLEKLAANYDGRRGFISNFYEDYGDDKVQLFGTVVGGAIEAGQKLSLADGTVVSVLQIYADRNNPEMTSSSVAADAKDVAIMFTLQNSNQLQAFKNAVDSAGVVFLESI